jgi:hypothetical protein
MTEDNRWTSLRGQRLAAALARVRGISMRKAVVVLIGGFLQSLRDVAFCFACLFEHRSATSYLWDLPHALSMDAVKRELSNQGSATCACRTVQRVSIRSHAVQDLDCESSACNCRCMVSTFAGVLLMVTCLLFMTVYDFDREQPGRRMATTVTAGTIRRPRCTTVQPGTVCSSGC